MSEEEPNVVQVGEVVVMKHCVSQCRHCRKTSDGWCWRDMCPHCGCPSERPLNHEESR